MALLPHVDVGMITFPVGEIVAFGNVLAQQLAGVVVSHVELVTDISIAENAAEGEALCKK